MLKIETMNRLLAALAVCVTVVMSAEASSDEATLEATFSDWKSAYEQGDIDRLMSHYHPDAFIALNGQPMFRGSDAVESYFTARLAGGSRKMDLAVERITISGEMAELIARYRLTLDLPNVPQPIVLAGRSVLIYRQADDGRWLIYTDIDNQDPTITPEMFD